MISLILTVMAIHVLAMMIPGPTFVVSARIAAADGLVAALGFALGVSCGSLIWAVAAMFGLSVLFEFMPAVLGALKVLGGLFLIWIAISLWRHAAEPLAETGAKNVPRGLLSSYRLGLMTQLANPKTAVYFGAVFAGLIPPHTDPRALLVILIGILCVETLWFSAIARVFSLGPARRGYIRVKKWIDRAFGGLIAVFGLKIATS